MSRLRGWGYVALIFAAILGGGSGGKKESTVAEENRYKEGSWDIAGIVQRTGATPGAENVE